jgi:DNA invertase Pin-like site-specific DNA recombinase
MSEIRRSAQAAQDQSTRKVDNMTNATRPVRVVLYARVSTSNGQQDPEMQLRELRDYVERRGWVIAGEFVDHGVSGSKDSRPSLNRLMADAHARKFDAVLVWKIDRWGRSLKHLVTSLADLDALGIAFVSLRDNLDLTTPSGRLMMQLLGAMAEFERALIQERVKAGLRNARAKGKRLGRPRVFVSQQRVEMLRGLGLSWRDIAKQMGVGVGTVHRIAQRRSKNVCGSFGTDGLTEPEETGVICALAEPLTAGG